MIHELSDFVTRPTVAVAASLGSVIVSLLPHLESGMRLGTLAAVRHEAHGLGLPALTNTNDGAAYIPFQFILVTGTNSGAVTFQFKPNGANTHAVVGEGSYLRAEVVEVP